MSERHKPTHIVLKTSNYLFSGYSALIGLMTPGIYSFSDATFMDFMAHLSAWSILMVGFWFNATHAPNLNLFSASSAVVVTIGGLFHVFNLPLMMVFVAYVGLGMLSHILKSSYLAKLDVLAIICSIAVAGFLFISSIHVLL